MIEDIFQTRLKVISLFQNLIGVDDYGNDIVMNSLIGHLPSLITHDMNSFLTKTFNEDEIKGFTLSMGVKKYLGPNEFTTILFQIFWHFVGKDNMDIMLEV